MTVTASGLSREPVLFEFIGPPRHRDTSSWDDQATSPRTRPVPPGEYMPRVNGSQSGVSGEQTVRVEETPVIVRSEELNQRTGPGYDYPAIDAGEGDELTVVAVNWDDTWLRSRRKRAARAAVADLVELNSLENALNSKFNPT